MFWRVDTSATQKLNSLEEAYYCLKRIKRAPVETPARIKKAAVII
jgi:hypothetical protein